MMDMNSSGVNTYAQLNTKQMVPDLNNTRDIGTAALKYKDVYSTSIKTDTVECSGVIKMGSLAPSGASTVGIKIGNSAGFLN